MAIYKRGRGFELGSTEKQIQVVVKTGLEPGTAGLRVRHTDHSTTLLPIKTKSSRHARTRSLALRGSFMYLTASSLDLHDLFSGLYCPL